MSCRGKCDSFDNGYFGVPNYRLGYKFCRNCNFSIIIDSIFCPCCNNSLRLSSRRRKEMVESLIWFRSGADVSE